MVFTSIQTTPGWSDNSVKAAYSLAFGWALRHNRIFEPFVDFVPQQVPQPGSSITVNLNNYYATSDVVAATTPLVEQTDVVATKLPATNTVTFTPQEYGFANEWTIKLAKRGLTPVDPVIATAVAAHCRDPIDYLVQTALRANTNVTRPAGRAATVNVTAGSTDYLKATMVRQAVTALRSRAAQPRDGQFFVGVAHPNAIHDLREETGSGSWRVPKEYGTDQGQIWNGEFGEFEGVRWVTSATALRASDNDGAASAQVFRSFIMGKEALGKAVVSAPQTVMSPVIDKLERFRGLGWKADLDYKIYRDAAIQRLESVSSLTGTPV